MYNRYIPDDADYTQVVEEAPPRPAEEAGREREQQTSPSGGQPRRPGPQPAQEENPGPGLGQGQNQGQTQSPFGAAGFRLPQFLSGKDGLTSLFSGKDGLTSLFSGKEGGGLSSLLKALHLENVDTGDILLLLIILFLLVEGDDLELVIALGLVLLMGLGDKGEKAT